jgi:hypothetical protein
MAEDLMRPYPVPNDENDFLQTDYKKKHSWMLILGFLGFPYILIAYFFIFSATFGSSSYSDLISCIYLFLALYYLLHFRKLYTLNSKILTFVRTYNVIVLFAILLFQSPLFPCPYVLIESSEDGTTTSVSYISKTECETYTSSSSTSSTYSFTSESKWMIIYIIVVESIGLIKLYAIGYEYILLLILTEI